MSEDFRHSTDIVKNKGIHITEVIRKIIILSNKAYAQGLISLDRELSAIQPSLLRKGIELILEMEPPEEVRAILDSHISREALSEAGLLECNVIKEGVLLLQSGAKTRVLLEKFRSILGQDNCPEAMDLLFSDEAFFTDEKKTDPFPGRLAERFEGSILEISKSEEMERLVLRAGTWEMALALRGATRYTVKHLFYYLRSREVIKDIKSLFRGGGPCRLTDIRRAQKRVINLIALKNIFIN